MKGRGILPRGEIPRQGYQPHANGRHTPTPIAGLSGDLLCLEIYANFIFFNLSFPFFLRTSHFLKTLVPKVCEESHDQLVEGSAE